MKRFWLFSILTFFFIATVCVGSASICDADDQYICGKTYTFFQSEVTYLLKFNSTNPDLPCTSGTAILSWLDSRTTYDFSIDSREMITIKNVGRAFAVGSELIWLDSATIVFEEF